MIYPVPKPSPKLKAARTFSSLPKKRAEERRSGQERDPAYLVKVRSLPCAARGIPGHTCGGRVESDHQGTRPLGRKCHDVEAVPMCQLAHHERTNYIGAFKGFTAVEMRALCDRWIAETQARLGYVRPPEAT